MKQILIAIIALISTTVQSAQVAELTDSKSGALDLLSLAQLDSSASLMDNSHVELVRSIKDFQIQLEETGTASGTGAGSKPEESSNSTTLIVIFGL